MSSPRLISSVFRKVSFKVKVHATTVLGHVLSGRRTYHTCVGKTKSKKRSQKS